MSTAELKEIVDRTTPDERAWLEEYLRYVNRPRKVRDATPEEVERFGPLMDDMEARRNCLTGEQYFTRLEVAEGEPAR